MTVRLTTSTSLVQGKGPITRPDTPGGKAADELGQVASAFWKLARSAGVGGGSFLMVEREGGLLITLSPHLSGDDKKKAAGKMQDALSRAHADFNVLGTTFEDDGLLLKSLAAQG